MSIKIRAKNLKVCEYCQQLFKPAKSDQKFCCDRHRIKFHNKIKQAKRKEAKKSFENLSDNEIILQDFLLDGNNRPTIKQILDAGLNLDSCISKIDVPGGQYFCFYRYWLFASDKEELIIFKAKNHEGNKFFI